MIELQLTMITFFIIMIYFKVVAISQRRPPSALPAKELMKEFDSFVIENLTRIVLERLIAAKPNSAAAFNEISDPKEPFFQGMVAKIIGSMSSTMRANFYSVYKETKTDEFLINYVSQLIEMYGMILVNRVSLYQRTADDENDRAAQTPNYDGLPPITNVREWVDDMLIESVIGDISSFKNMFDVITQTQTKPEPKKG